MKRTYQALFGLLACTTASGLPLVHIDGGLYEVRTVTGLLGSYRSTIESQVWFGNQVLSERLANEFGAYFGVPNYSLYGPMFAHSIYDGVGADYTIGFVFAPHASYRAQENNAAAGVYYTFAVGNYISSVPEPSSFALLAFGALLLAGRKQLANKIRGQVSNIKSLSPCAT